MNLKIVCFAFTFPCPTWVLVFVLILCVWLFFFLIYFECFFGISNITLKNI